MKRRKRKIRRVGNKAYQRGGDVVDNNGYLDSNRDNYTPVKIIESNDITMEGVSENVIAFPTDENGDIIGMKFMQPGENYKFEGAENTIEFPQFRRGGRKERNKWISDKISKLRKEGKGQSESVAIAYSMYSQKHENGGKQLPEYQRAGQVSDPFTSAARSVSSIRWPWQQSTNQIPPEQQTQIGQSDYIRNFNLPNGIGETTNSTYENFVRSGFRLPTAELESYGGVQPFQNTYTPFMPLYEPSSSINTGEVSQGEIPDIVIDEEQAALDESRANAEYIRGLPTGQNEGFGTASLNFESAADEILQQELENTSDQQRRQPTGNPNFQFFNPYAGVDIPQAASIFGSSVEGGDTASAIASGAKLGLGLFRNILGGVGQQRRNDFVMDEYRQRQRNAQTQAVYGQDGGVVPDFALTNERPDFNFGKYGELDYFTAQPNGDSLLIQNTANNPHNRETLQQLYPYLQELNPNTQFEIDYVPPQQFQNGGKVTEEKLLTGEFVTGNPNNPEANAEVETGEFIKHPDGTTQKVLGDNHENGGEEMFLKEDTKIISDHLKVGAKNAKTFRKNFDLNIKAKNTYADILESYNKKSGLDDITKEQEEVIEEIKKQKNKAAEGGADEASINLNIEFLTGKLNELEQKKIPLKEAQKVLYDKVFELQEESKPKEEQQDTFEIGGQVYNNDQVIALAKQYNIEPDRAVELLNYAKGGKHLPQYQNGPTQPSDEEIILRDLLSNVGIADEYTDENIINTIVSQFGDPYANVFENYFQVEEGKSGIERITPTQATLDIFQNDVTPSATSDPNPATAEDATQTETIPAQRGQVQVAGDITPQGAQLQRPSSTARTTPIPIADINIENSGPMFGGPGFSVREEENNGNILSLPLLPDQTPLPPESLQPHLKVTRRFDRIEPALISPDAQLAELRRNVQAQEQQINQLPDSQRRAALAQLQANAQSQQAKIMSEVQRYNAQAQQQANAVNVQQQGRQEEARAADILNFEQRQLGALAKTQQDIRNYFNALSRINVENFNTVNQMNMLNQLYDNFQLTGQGLTEIGEEISGDDIMNMVRFQQATQTPTTQQSYPTQRRRAKRGGKKSKK